MTSLDGVPNEVLEHIAFYSGSEQLLGPPSTLPILLTLNRKINGALSPASTPHLYARIFAAKFDMAAPLRRLGASALTASVLMEELRSRCIVLKRIRTSKDCLKDKSPDTANGDDDLLDDLLWTAYLMMLENDGKNAAQLKNYANMGEWLSKYWFDPRGMSDSVNRLQLGRWPTGDDRAALAMWLLWWFFDPGNYTHDIEMKRKATVVIKPYALGGHKYPLATTHWTNFSASPLENNILISSPDSFVDSYSSRPSTSRAGSNTGVNTRPEALKSLRWFSLENIYVSPPPAAIPAILCYLALLAREELETAEVHDDVHHGFHNSTTTSDAFIAYFGTEEAAKQSSRWDCQWYRCLSLGGGVEQIFRAGGNTATDTEGLLQNGIYRLGSIEGVWEGIFSYTEFTSYASLLSGAPPQALQASLLVQHRQTWKLREYHLLADVPYSSSSSSHPSDFSTRDPLTGIPVVDPFPSTDQGEGGQGNGNLVSTPLPSGEALRAHLPPSNAPLTMTESADTLTLTLPESYRSPPQGMTPFTTESTEASAASADGGSGHTNHNTVKYVYKRHHRPAYDEKHRNGSNSGLEGTTSYAARVKDVLLVGEGHSSWGEFKLLGRIRPLDGFLYLAKEYTGGDRGRWLYRGYLVGAGGGFGAGGAQQHASSDGYLVGRWRDTLSPINTHGYEGCFGMTRRR